MMLTLMACAGTTLADDPPTLADDLQHLHEEEKLARDLYRELAERWDAPMFRRIAQSEQRHMDQVARLLEAEGIADPVGDNPPGVFSSPALSDLYTRLLRRGRRSALDAFRVGAEVEDLDIADIRAMRGRTSNPEVRSTYALLECGSNNHLRAFTRQIRAEGGSYAPQHLAPAAFREILAAPHERCGRRYGRGGGMRGMRGMRGGMRGMR